MIPAPLKIVIVGDGAVGKTCLLNRFTEGTFPKTYVPTVFDNAEAALTLDDGRDCLVSLWDTAGQEDYAHLRRMSFPNVDAFVVAFSSTRASSFDNVVRTWLPECAEADATAPVILARTKIDLPSRVDHAMGAALAREVGVGYVSTSALTGEGVRELVHAAARAALDQRERAAARLAKRTPFRRALAYVGLLFGLHLVASTYLSYMRCGNKGDPLGRVVLVTGAASGIGRALCEELTTSYSDLVLCVDAEDHFLSRLAGEADPEKKRKSSATPSSTSSTPKPPNSKTPTGSPRAPSTRT